MVKHTIWKPDTCECVIVNQWDTKDDPPIITPVAHSASRVCPIHQSVTATVPDDTSARRHADAVTSENVGKNEAVAAVADALGIERADVGWALDDVTRSLVLAVPASVQASEKARARVALAAVSARHGRPMDVN